MSCNSQSESVQSESVQRESQNHTEVKLQHRPSGGTCLPPLRSLQNRTWKGGQHFASSPAISSENFGGKLLVPLCNRKIKSVRTRLHQQAKTRALRSPSRSKTRNNGLRRDCMADYKPAILRIQIEVSLTREVWAVLESLR